ncbi:MAG: hypothetical protein ACXVJJ_00200 [Halobacteriota archaeon]
MKKAGAWHKDNAKADKSGPVEQEWDRSAAKQSTVKSVNEVRDRRTVHCNPRYTLEARNPLKNAANEE